jgi:hypothetical protein
MWAVMQTLDFFRKCGELLLGAGSTVALPLLVLGIAYVANPTTKKADSGTQSQRKRKDKLHSAP